MDRRRAIARRNADAIKPKAAVVPKLDAEQKMFKGTPLEGAASDPTRDPLWLRPEDLEVRQRVMSEVDAFEHHYGPCGFFTHTVNVDGEAIPAHEFVEMQRRSAYKLLSRGVDARQVAVEVFRPVDWVEALKKEFDL